ncbi:3-deoxy-D-manno-octulosonic-acid transferase [Actimicrobium sp. GrIS 1.19]|uniref:lipid IV(A) 3-deoxy-D-manno-octulosonic acid transferase n=1 Tax=Actimicrobium sp. GrIS 1.19 TaxID=3071708 RepID=UPI002E0D0150|nr:3-deoxy-D-manno-octulosonic-acid transferase [Actimicrobium sp. GrIS 1.19]
MRHLYSLAWWLAMPLVLARLWWRGRREPGYRAHLAERFGFPAPRRRSAPLLWLHAVSVGETRAAEPLIDALLLAYPQHDLLLTHMTPTGRAAGAALFARHGARLTQAYLPYDTGTMVGRFLRVFKPRICILMETEIWPNVMAMCAARQVPVVLVNARLSPRSLAKAGRLGRLMSDAAGQLTCVAAQTEADAARIRSLGVRNVEVTGSIKFDVTPPELALQAGAQLRRQIGTRPVLLLASSREGEEALILDALGSVAMPPDSLLLLVPRHPQRFDTVAALVTARGLRLQRKSTLGDAAVVADVLLGDTMGEMFAYFSACDLAWIGGSLLPLGGQNLIEACAVGKPVLLGPHTFNFALVSEDAIEAGAALRVADARAMLVAAADLLHDDIRRGVMSAAALHFAQQHRGATARTMLLLQPLLDPS